MPEQTRLTHVLIFVSNLQRSRDFYQDAFGLVALHEENDYVRLSGMGVDLGLHHAYEPEKVGAAGLELQLRVVNVDDWYGRMSERGIAFLGAPEDMPWGARHAFLRDPDGYRLSIYSSKDGNGD